MYTANIFPRVFEHSPLPTKFIFIRTQKSGMPSPIMKNAKRDAQICVVFPKSPIIMLDSILSDTFGIESAPRLPTAMYSADDMIFALFSTLKPIQS